MTTITPITLGTSLGKTFAKASEKISGLTKFAKNEFNAAPTKRALPQALSTDTLCLESSGKNRLHMDGGCSDTYSSYDCYPFS